MKKLFFIAAISFYCSCIAGQMSFELESKHINKVTENDIQRFNATVWKQSNSTIRGEMLYDLFQSNTFIGKPKKYVVDLLGKSTGEFISKDRPCYAIKYDGETYYLGFRVVENKGVIIIDAAVLYRQDELSRTWEKVLEGKSKAKKYIINFKDTLVMEIKKYANKFITYLDICKNKTAAYIKTKIIDTIKR